MLKKTMCLSLMFVFLFASSVPATAEKLVQTKRNVEVVFVLDTTGSMSGLIEGAKKKIWAIANSILDQYPNADVKMGLIGYRDLGDEYVLKSYPLTRDIQEIYAKLLVFKADGGGDWEESVNEALDAAVTKMDWTAASSQRVDRIIFLVGDAPPHMDYPQGRKYPEIIKEAVQQKITVNTVLAGDSSETQAVWKKMATLGKGDFLQIPQDGGRVVIIDTPYDICIREIQIRLNTTVIPYGSIAQQRNVESKQEMYEGVSASSASEMSKYVNKANAGKAVITGSGDLVSDFEDGSVAELSALAQEELPENMRSMTVDEQKTYINTLSTERSKLATELAEQVRLRDVFIAEAQVTDAPPVDSFDAAVSETLKKQLQ